MMHECRFYLKVYDKVTRKTFEKRCNFGYGLYTFSWEDFVAAMKKHSFRFIVISHRIEY